MAFGEAVRAARTVLGWSQAELGRRAGVSRPTIARLEQGRDGHTHMLDKVASVLGLGVTVEPLEVTNDIESDDHTKEPGQ